eukprot:m.209298 g.209298  ORF g.209298 m.209298 type:complete len:608 (-) comp24538_c0_seq1:107-1930(-)
MMADEGAPLLDRSFLTDSLGSLDGIGGSSSPDHTKDDRGTDGTAYAAAGGNGQSKGIVLSDAYDAVGFGPAQYRVILVCGLCFMSDSIEIGLLSFLQHKAKDEFDLGPFREALLSSVVFVGEFIGACTLGPLADRYGRWRMSVVGAAFVGIMGLASAFANSFEILALFRCLVGVGIGGLSVPFDILAEFVPPKQRGRSLMAVEFFWSIGTLFVAGLAWGILEDLGWRMFVGLCSIPVLLALAGFSMMPESPHWLLTQGRGDEALAILQHAAVRNGRPPFSADTHLVVGGSALVQSVPNPLWEMPVGAGAIPPSESRTLVGGEALGEDADTDRGDKETRQRSLAAAETAWQIEKAASPEAVTHFMGTPEGARKSGGGGGGAGGDRGRTVSPTASRPGSGSSRRHSNQGLEKALEISNSPAELFKRPLVWTTLRLFVIWLCFSFSYYGVLLILPEVLSDGDGGLDYTALLISSGAEVVACCIGIALIDSVGRAWTSGVSYVLCGVFMACMAANGLSPAAIITLSMLARGAIFIGSSATWVVTPELFPTQVRGTGHSWCNAFARIGGMATPFWGRALLPQGTRLAVYAAVSTVCGLVSMSLRETRGSMLK